MKFREIKNCYIVAEVSANHAQNFERAIKMVRTAAECGADAVKFQVYTPDTLTMDCENECFKIKHPKWGGQTLYRLYEKSYMPWGWLGELKKAANDAGIDLFATSFDPSSVDALEAVGVDIHKIASFELVDIPLIKYAAATGKTLMMSTGMATVEEIREAVNAATEAGAAEIVLFKCVSSYPALPEEMNLRTIPHMAEQFGCPIGLSDHTEGSMVALAAVSLGAKVIEKHFTLSRRDATADSFFSLEPEELRELVKNVRSVEKALGEVHYGPSPSEEGSKAFRRSLFAVSDICKGEKFGEGNIRSIRPSDGLPPARMEAIMGKKAVQDIKRGTPLSEDMIEDGEEL
ncbi:MAG: pseudaminic acid synthase [Candidatus Omnitrophica bacterium]|nr:pseudaminic acid synthase [Candidatus Omnitrophota bacterium]MDD5488830.1 pseudaminic acid synthase [Candidatus Omnitrophota bacterium]